MYRVGFPLWKLAARLGVPMLVKLEVVHDRAAGVFVVTSSGLKGLVVEVSDSASAEEVHREIHGCVEMLMAEMLQRTPGPGSVATAWPGEFAPA